MESFIISFLNKLSHSSSAFSPLSYSNLNPNINKSYLYLKSRLPSVLDSKLKSLSIVLQYLNLSQFDINELIALSNLNWALLDSFLINEDTSNCVLGKQLLYDTRDGRIQIEITNSENTSDIKLQVFNYFNSGDINSLKNIIIFLMKGE